MDNGGSTGGGSCTQGSAFYQPEEQEAPGDYGDSSAAALPSGRSVGYPSLTDSSQAISQSSLFQELGWRKLDMISRDFHHRHMYAWYLATEAPFDFTVKDMPVLRKWWCTGPLENFHLDGHGRRFAHFTKEAKQMADGLLPPVFRLKRKREVNEL